MRKFILMVATLFIALPACAAVPVKLERTQETVQLGNNRFLIFVGEPNDTQYAYTADLIVINNGIPHFEPLFIEDYDIDTHSTHLSEGLVFLGSGYHFDNANNLLTFITIDPEKHARFQYKYTLAVDMLKLQEVAAQKMDSPATLPKIIYKAAPANAQTH